MSGLNISGAARVATQVAFDVASAAVVRAVDSLPDLRVQASAQQMVTFLRSYLSALILKQREENYVLTNCSIQAAKGELPYEWMMVHGSSVPVVY